jgi:hypothetical protein
VNQATAVLTFGVIPAQYLGNQLTVSASSASTGAITYTVLSGPATIVSGVTPPPASLVQTVVVPNGPGTGVFTAPNTAGNSILILLPVFTNQTPTIADTQANTYQQIAYASDALEGAGGWHSAAFLATNIKGGANTVSFAVGFTTAFLLEYQGLAALDTQAAMVNAVPADEPAPMSLTFSTQGPDLVVAAMYDQVGAVETLGLPLILSGTSTSVYAGTVAGAGTYTESNTQTSRFAQTLTVLGFGWAPGSSALVTITGTTGTIILQAAQAATANYSAAVATTTFAVGGSGFGGAFGIFGGGL